MDEWQNLQQDIVQCERCPRLREHCLAVAAEKRRSFVNWEYWGKPVPNFGDDTAKMLIVGLAPAAHGANRTGRMFTGDRSGDWLYRALHRAGFANQSYAENRDDGLTLYDCAITAVCHCAPPQNRPTPKELENCSEWLTRTIELVDPRVFVALGQIAWKSTVNQAKRRQWYAGKAPQFGHGAAVPFEDGRWLIGSYHPSQQNTFTGKLTEDMFDSVFRLAKEKLSQP